MKHLIRALPTISESSSINTMVGTMATEQQIGSHDPRVVAESFHLIQGMGQQKNRLGLVTSFEISNPIH